MDKLKNYLLSNFSQIYFSIFLPLFVIASVIMLVKIAAYTAFIKLTLFEMIKLYLFLLPELMFYTLPVTFFIAAVMTIAKLSNDYEMLVIFSLGVKPMNLVLFFLKLAVLQSVLLFMLFFIVSPHTKNLQRNFMNKKRSEAKFNIEASEYGHKFGDWMIFVGKSDHEDSYGNVILFNQKDKEETLIVAEKANVISVANALKLELHQGKGFTYSTESLSQMKFRTMRINDVTDMDKEEYKDTFDYWFGDWKLRNMYEEGTNKYRYYQNDLTSKLRKLSNQLLITLFPMLTVLFILSIGVINARHQKGFTYVYIFTVVIVYYASTFVLGKPLGLYSLAVVGFATLLISSLLYNYKIAKRY